MKTNCVVCTRRFQYPDKVIGVLAEPLCLDCATGPDGVKTCPNCKQRMVKPPDNHCWLCGYQSLMLPDEPDIV